MQCARCGAPTPASNYCPNCGTAVNPPAPERQEPISRARDYFASALSLAAAACVIVALLTTYSVVGTAGTPITLHDDPGTLAYNLVFASALTLGTALACPGATRRFGLGLIVGGGVLFPLLLIGDIGSMLRSGPEGTSDYIAPMAGFYWGLSSALLATAGGIAAVATLRASVRVRLAPQPLAPLWAVIGLATTAAWIIGTWRPWEQNILTLTVNGQTQTIPYNPCCSLPSLTTQWIAQPIALAVAVAGLSIIAACLSSKATAAGTLFAAALYTGATILPLLFHRPWTLDQLAPGLKTTTDQLQQDAATVQLHILGGAWIAAGASLVLLLLAVARGLSRESGQRTSPVSDAPPSQAAIQA